MNLSKTQRIFVHCDLQPRDALWQSLVDYRSKLEATLRLSVSLRRSEQRGALFVPDALEMNPLRNDPTFIL